MIGLQDLIDHMTKVIKQIIPDATEKQILQLISYNLRATLSQNHAIITNIVNTEVLPITIIRESVEITVNALDEIEKQLQDYEKSTR